MSRASVTEALAAVLRGMTPETVRQDREQREALAEFDALPPEVDLAILVNEHAEEYDSDCSEHYGCGCGWQPSVTTGCNMLKGSGPDPRAEWQMHMVAVIEAAL